MKVYRSLNEFKRLSYAAVTSGTFDGVHKGHQKILTSVAEAARKANGESVVITFWPHPKKVLKPTGAPLLLLTTMDEKMELISQCGIDHFLIIPFTKEFAQLTSLEFVNDILIQKIGTKKLIIGYDHKFGKNREGSFEFLKENASAFGFEVEEIPRQDIENTGVSSTIIRKALQEGNVSTAAQYLGRYYSVSGTVVKGKQLGRTIGFPTANIQVTDPEKLIPKDGIYAVKVKKAEVMFDGMLSIGYNPTVNGTEKTTEVNIFKFNEEIYNQSLEIFFIEYLRKEEKFNSLEDLVKQLYKDQEDSERILSQIKF